MPWACNVSSSGYSATLAVARPKLPTVQVIASNFGKVDLLVGGLGSSGRAVRDKRWLGASGPPQDILLRNHFNAARLRARLGDRASVAW